MTCHWAVILFLQILPASRAALSRRATPCPDCLNGGLCLPNNGRFRGGHSINAQADARCFCRSPWTGASCEINSEEDDQPSDDASSKKVVSDSVPLENTKAEDVDVQHGEVQLRDDILLVNFALDADADQSYKDPDNIQYGLYTALCPSSPCSTGLVLEDIKVLSLSEDQWRRLEVHLAISPPSSDPTQPPSSRSASMAAIKAQVAAQLVDMHSSLRADAFGGLILHSGFQLVNSKVVKQPDDGGNTLADMLTLRGSMDASKISAETKPATHAHERLIPHREDRNVSLHEQHRTSCATVCITVTAVVFLLFSVVHVSVERACRWLFADEPDQVDKKSMASEGLDEFESNPDPKSSRRERDFTLLRDCLEVLKNPLGPSVVYAIFIYTVQARVRELTHGFGDPSALAEYCMITLTATNLVAAAVWVIAVVFWGAGLQKKQNGKPMFLNMQLYPNILTMICRPAIKLVEVFAFSILYFCAWTMTPEDCGIGLDVFQGKGPPPIALEHQMVLFFVGHFFLMQQLERLAVGRHMFVLYRHPDSGDHVQEDAEKCIIRWRLLMKTCNPVPLLSIITLAIHEVPIFVGEDAQIRNVLLYANLTVMISYSLFILITITIHTDVDVTQGFGGSNATVTVASHTDYLVHPGDKPGDTIFRNTRRALLMASNFLALALASSVFFLRCGAGPGPVVPWAVMWALCIMMQFIIVRVLNVIHEATSNDENDKDEQNEWVLKSAVREIEGFMQLAPMLGLLFLCAQARAMSVMKAGQMPQWVLTAISSIAQTLVLQLVVTLIEANVGSGLTGTGGLVNQRRWTSMRKGATTGASGLLLPRSQLQDGAGLGLHDDGDQPDAALQDSARVAAVSSQTEGARPSEEGEDGLQPDAAQSMSSSVFDGQLEQEYELEFLATKFLNLFCTLGQFVLITGLYVSANLVVIAIWTMDSDMRHRQYTSTDWKTSVFPLLPVSVEMTTGMESIVWLVALFLFVKGGFGLILNVQDEYQTIDPMLSSAMEASIVLVDLAPLVALLCLMLQARAASFHGLNASPSVFVQCHMIAVVMAMKTEVIAGLATPVLTGEMTKKETKGRIIPFFRRMIFGIQQLASIIIFWSLGVLLYAFVWMTPEDVVLANGTTSVPWHSEVPPPSVHATAWNMWSLCIMTFIVAAIDKFTFHQVTLKRYADGDVTNWCKIISERDRWPMVRYFHAAALSRKTALGSVLLGSLFVPLELLIAHQAVSKDYSFAMELLFFVASLILCVKVFVAFCFGMLEEPRAHYVFEAQCREDTEQPKVLQRASASSGFGLKASNPSNPSNAFAVTFRRVAVGLTACETLLVGALVSMIFVLLHSHITLFSTAATLNGSLLLFGLYFCTHFMWSFAVLFGYEIPKLDGLLEIVSFAPLILILLMACRQRALEAAGRHGVVPGWIQEMIFVCSVILMVEFVTIACAPHRNKKKEQRPNSTYTQLQDKDVSWGSGTRVGFLVTQALIRFTLYSCLSLIIFGLFWMTEEQCLPGM